MLCEEDVLIDFAIFIGKKPVLESLLNKDVGLQACNFIKKRLQHRYFPVNIAKFLRTRILRNICERLLLNLIAINGETSALDTFDHVQKI